MQSGSGLGRRGRQESQPCSAAFYHHQPFLMWSVRVLLCESGLRRRASLVHQPRFKLSMRLVFWSVCVEGAKGSFHLDINCCGGSGVAYASLADCTILVIKLPRRAISGSCSAACSSRPWERRATSVKVRHNLNPPNKRTGKTACPAGSRPEAVPIVSPRRDASPLVCCCFQKQGPRCETQRRIFKFRSDRVAQYRCG